MGGATTSARTPANPEAVANIPLPPFAVALIGANAATLLASPLLLFYQDYHGGGHFGPWFALAAFALPIAICYSLATHRRATKLFLWLQAIALLLWAHDPGFVWLALASLFYVTLAPKPRLYFNVIRRGYATPEETQVLAQWPRLTMPVLDWFSELVYWLAAFAALYIFAGLFFPQLLFSPGVG
ncbi:MAG: hypothetical protein AAF513_06225 [Pseudomonadota bacterium]